MDRERGPHIGSSCWGKERAPPAASPNRNGARDDATAAKPTRRDADWPAAGGGSANIGDEEHATLNGRATGVNAGTAQGQNAGSELCDRSRILNEPRKGRAEIIASNGKRTRTKIDQAVAFD